MGLREPRLAQNRANCSMFNLARPTARSLFSKFQTGVMGNTNCGDCMSEDAANGDRRSLMLEDRVLDQLNRKSDAARYAIKYPYQPMVEHDRQLAREERDARPTLNLDDNFGLYSTPNPRPKSDKLDLSISLSDIRQVRDSVPLSEIRCLQAADNHESPVQSQRVSKRRNEPYLNAYQVPDYFERPAFSNQQASRQPYPQGQKENSLFVPAVRQRKTAEQIQIGWQNSQNYYY